MRAETIDKLILTLAETLDRDLAKQLHPETTEDPEEALSRMEELRDVVGKILLPSTQLTNAVRGPVRRGKPVIPVTNQIKNLVNEIYGVI